MASLYIMRFCLDAGLAESASSGRHNFFNLLREVAQDAGWAVEYGTPQDAERMDAYAITHMQQPIHDRALTVRRTITYPFWQIERCAERWLWDVATKEFHADMVPAAEAKTFAGYWRKRLFGTGPAPTREGFVFVPLQGRILHHRSFQSMSPLDMLKCVLRHDPQREVVATLHPKETHGQDEILALEGLARKEPRLKISERPSTELLRSCDYVATQNSTLGFLGLFFDKPLALFARIDFHHIAASIVSETSATQIADVSTMRPDFDKYIWWFLQSQSINAGRPDAKDKIKARLQAAGWPL